MTSSLLTKSTPPVKELKGPSNTGGTAAPSGSSVAAQMVKNTRSNQRAAQQHLRTPKFPNPNERRPQAKIPKTGALKGPSSKPVVSGTSSTVPNPYNALNSPYRTEGEFNKAVGESAKAGYQPKLDELSTAEEGQKGLTTAREADNVSIYKTYSEQAQQAFQAAKQSLAEIASRANASTQAGQEALQAALSNTGVSGLKGVNNPTAFMAEASGLGNESSQTFAGEQSGIIGELGKDQAVPLAGLNEANREDRVNEGGVLNKLQAERDKINRSIPELTEKTRQEMLKDEETREANRLQEQIAEQKLGIEKEAKVEIGKEKNQLVREAAKEKNEAAERIKREEAGIKEQAVQNQKKALEEKIALAKNKHQEAVAKLEAARYDNGLKIMTSYLKMNTKTEYTPGAQNAQAQLAEGKSEYRRNAMHLYEMLTKGGNLSPPEAFRLMQSASNGYIKQFAEEHEATYNRSLKAAHDIPTTRNKAGGLQDAIPKGLKK